VFEVVFSGEIKTKHTTRLTVEVDLKSALSSAIPRIRKLAVEREAQPSH
jgi:hypothetical protein